MPTKSYHEMLSEDLRDPEVACEYLSTALESRNTEPFLRALRNIVDSHGGLEILLDIGELSRQDIEDVLNPSSNPPLRSIIAILQVLGISLSFVPDDKGN